MNRQFVCLAVLVVVLFGMAVHGHAQVSAGAVLGTVSDPSGALIPGVTITVTNEGTNQSRQAISNESGSYRVEPLQAGFYTVSAELSGFKKELRTHINIDVDARVRMDFTLQVGQVSETVDVSAAAPLVQTDDSQVNAVMDQRKVVDLPLNGRNFSQLAYLTPGTFAPRPGSHLSYRGGFVAAGLAEKTNQFFIDGVNNNGAGTMETAYRINIDTVAEFKIQTQNYNAEYGRFAGAQVDTVLKSGTNEFHGSAFAFTRNDDLDARNYFDPYPFPNTEVFRRHQYGAVLGGPVIKDKFFYFTGFQGQRQFYLRRANATVPFPEFFTGDLSRYTTLIKDPLNGQPFQGNKIPANRLDPTALKFQPYWFGVTPYRDSFSRNALSLMPEPENFWQPDIKLNYNINSKHQLIGHWGLYDSDLLEWQIANQPELPNYNEFAKVKNQHIGIQEIWTINSAMVNELRGGISRVGRVRLPYLHDRDYARDVFGIPGTVGDVDPVGYSIPQIAINGFSTINPAGPQPRTDGNWMIVDTLAIQKKNHAIKFGGDVFRQYMNLIVLSAQAGAFTFNGFATGNAFADFLLGMPFTSSRAFPLGPISMHPNKWTSNWFVQDSWKYTHNLTLDYGLRFEFTRPMDEKWGRWSTFDPDLNGGKGGIRLGNPDKMYTNAIDTFQSYYPGLFIERNGQPLYVTAKQWAPRVGFAWTPGGQSQTVIRGGYGMFYTLDSMNLTGLYSLVPFLLTQRFTSADKTTFSNPWPGGVGISGTINEIGIAKDYKNGTFQHFNLDIQHQLPMGIVADIAYVGKKGNRIDATRDINQPINGVKPYQLFGPITFTEARGNSWYHGLQTRVERRSTTGLTLLFDYSWSKLLDNVDANGPVRDAYNLKQEKGPGQEDMRHRVSISYVYALPWGKGRMYELSTLNEALLGGWEISGIFRANSGPALTPTLSANISGYGRSSDRPNVIGDWRLSNPSPTAGWYNRAAFAMPASGVGNAGKGILTGPGYNGMDVSLMKRIIVGERKDIQFRAEFFDALNHSNFYPVSTVEDAATFGTTGLALDNRQIQFGLKFNY
jgi:hypothetical protein